ncbi:unnamed protein product [Euphydryas editha]|uniref:Uncharacterized protein n=1 Tax=Euphydryas editha TaxID=104508 RepID=A0AAU9UFX3_EUPED|nr:unnamed protein product [Euphydryas editha]
MVHFRCRIGPVALSVFPLGPYLADEIAQRAREVLASRAGVPPHRAPLKTPVGLLTRLPNLDLPRFDGRLDTWMGFIGLFESLVDSREDLGPSQELAYLLSVLDGEARGLVQHLPICDGSYEVARSLLNKRCHNQRCPYRPDHGHPSREQCRPVEDR